MNLFKQTRLGKWEKVIQQRCLSDSDRLAHGFRRGVTLLEMVVVIGIIGILLAIVIPAVQNARESARRTQCQNNQRQVVLAIQSFESAHGSLPSFYNGTSLAYPLKEWDLFHTHSWRVMLLPHLEQSVLRDKIEWKSFATDPINESVAQSVVSVFICPSGPDPLQNMGWGLTHASPPPSVGPKYRVTRSDYDAMAGIQVLPEPLPIGNNIFDTKFVRWGVWGWPNFGNHQIAGTQLLNYRAGKFRDVTDGLSNTIAIVERGGKPIDLLRGKPNVTPDNPDAYYPGQTGWSASNTFAWSMNQFKVGINQSNSTGIYSLHSGGANIAKADGSVQFLSDSTGFEELVRLFSRTGGPDEGL
jgi:prepilin-type N-terminal cleavage/methylation domain-containing protein/prepilin-type processing-associated H-X9-DG protein